MIKMLNDDEFDVTVGLMDHRHFECLAIMSCTPSGIFEKHRAGDLLEFCLRNSDFHIVSFLPGGLVLNKYNPRGIFFKLGQGNDNPNIAKRCCGSGTAISGKEPLTF